MRSNQTTETVSGDLITGQEHTMRRKNVLNRIKICGLIFVLYLILNLFHAGCPIKFITGVSCPGCGMTRAILSVLRLDFAGAFHYHPLFFLAPVMFFLFIFQDYIKPGVVKVSWIVLITLFILTYLYRLLFTQNEVVAIDFSGGLVVKLIQQLL